MSTKLDLRNPFVYPLFALACGLVLGGATAYAQGYLPEHLSSLANSAGSWTLAMFVLAMLAPGSRSAAASGFISLASMLAGYVITNQLRGIPSSLGMMIFWTAAAIIVGPLLGLGAQWFRRRRDVWGAFGLGAISAVLIGEGGYGLSYVSDTTSPYYWCGSIVLGLVLLIAGALRRFRLWRVRAAAAGFAALGSAGFIFIYSDPAGQLMLLLP